MTDAVRQGQISRTTKETQIEISLALPGDAPAPPDIETPIPFLTHMLEALAKHGAMGMRVRAAGDVEIDGHHTVEDVGLVLGAALDQALEDRKGISRYGHFSLCMDETLVDVAVDLGGLLRLRGAARRRDVVVRIRRRLARRVGAVDPTDALGLAAGRHREQEHEAPGHPLHPHPPPRCRSSSSLSCRLTSR